MKKFVRILLSALALLLAILACNFPGLQEPGIPPDVTAPVGGDLPTEPDSGPTEPQIEAPPTTQPPPSSTATITETPTVTPTFTPETALAWVTKNTNCRTGPGTEYDIVHIFLVGEKAEIIARSTVSNYVVVEAPDGSGRTCWLWMQYGQQSGSTEDLPQRTPPPTPTPSPTPTPAVNFKFDFEELQLCAGDDVVFLKLTNTGTMKLESYSISAKNQDTSESFSNQYGAFPHTPSCTHAIDPSISPGGSAYPYAIFTPPIGGDNVKFTLKVCAGDGLVEPCMTKTATYTIPAWSDENAKENFEPVDNSEILTLVSELPITSWSYKDSERQGRHIGPMAQDFNQRFGVGEYEKYISAVDSSGVALAAIQALSDISEAQNGRIAVLEEQNEQLKSQNEALDSRLLQLEARGSVLTWVPWTLLAAVLIFMGIWSGMRLIQRIKSPG